MESQLFNREWGNFSFKKTDDFDGVMEHLFNNFFLDEPIQNYVGTSVERKNDLDKRVRGILNLPDTICLVAIDNISNKIASVFIILHVSKENNIPEYPSSSPLSTIVRNFIINLECQKVNIFEMYGVDTFAEIYFISTGKEYRKIGLGTEICRRGLSIISSMKFPLVTAIFTNPLSRRIGQQYGFEEIAKSNFSEMRIPLMEAGVALPHVILGEPNSELYASLTAKVMN